MRERVIVRIALGLVEHGGLVSCFGSSCKSGTLALLRRGSTGRKMRGLLARHGILRLWTACSSNLLWVFRSHLDQVDLCVDRRVSDQSAILGQSCEPS
jgi:hypothetical protein